MEARKNLGIEGRFYTNGLELKHKLQKKRLREADVPKEVSVVTKELKSWSEEFYLEEIRALRGIGKYCLATGYESFFVNPVLWNHWSPERQSQHVSKFREFIPKSYDQQDKNHQGNQTKEGGFRGGFISF